jgi:hypothetical protein
MIILRSYHWGRWNSSRGRKFPVAIKRELDPVVREQPKDYAVLPSPGFFMRIISRIKNFFTRKS